MFGRRTRQRLDALRVRIDAESTETSVSVDDAVTRLERVIEIQGDSRRSEDATVDQLVDALDVIPQGIVLADRSGAVVFRNQAASGFFAARHSEALVEAAIEGLIARGVAGEAATEMLDLFGPPRRAIQLRAVPLADADAGGGGAFILVEDVSERQRLDAVRRDFVANISHELKTPVGAIGVLAETLADEGDPAVAARLAERMQREAFRVARTIDDLLQLSQIEARDLPEPEAVPVRRILDEAVERTGGAAEVARVRLVVEQPSSSWTVLGDRRQLVSAVANLCDNAVKYSDTAADVVIRARGDESWVDIDVIDEGIGIPARDQERVFERFYRVDRGRSRDTGGTGLGLAIVRHVIQNHGGAVSITSREGDGSTFTLRLPAGPAPVPDAASSPVHP